MIRLEISRDVLVEAISQAIRGQLPTIRTLGGYVDLDGACAFLSVGRTQLKKWVGTGLIRQHRVSSHLVRYRIDELQDFMEQFRKGGTK